jgi:hypothetical protein
LASYNGNLGFNTAVGANTLSDATTGQFNTAIGEVALNSLTTGLTNIAIGVGAGNQLVTGSGNVFIGSQGGFLPADESNRTYIRNINETDLSGINVDNVTVDLLTGLLGHATSSRRYKEDIRPMDKASEVLYRLKPVTFRYKKDVDKSQTLDYGLIAEDVTEVDPNLAIRNGKGQIENVRYNAITAMLLNEFLAEHKKIESQQATIAELKSMLAQQQEGIHALTAQLKEQAAQIQKVSAQLVVSKPPTNVVFNSP